MHTALPKVYFAFLLLLYWLWFAKQIKQRETHLPWGHPSCSPEEAYTCLGIETRKPECKYIVGCNIKDFLRWLKVLWLPYTVSLTKLKFEDDQRLHKKKEEASNPPTHNEGYYERISQETTKATMVATHTFLYPMWVCTCITIDLHMSKHARHLCFAKWIQLHSDSIQWGLQWGGGQWLPLPWFIKGCKY